MNRYLVAAAAAVLSLTACGGGSDNAIEQAIEDATGGSVDINTDGDGNVQIDTEDGSFSSGGSAEVPDDFPSDVPLPDGIGLTTTLSDESGWYLYYESGDLTAEYCEDFLASYEDAGFTEDTRFEASGDLTGIYSSDQYSVTASCSPSISTVSVTVQNATG